ncbi:nitroreductase family protein [Candidatus Sumerlaeota bacterium]|nr:nitroreductase family protein [Candidatus Sumerlaeota bacterium]
MKFKDLVLKNRSYRRFDGKKSIGRTTLRQLVDLARLSPSGGNKQALKFLLSHDSRKNARIFRHLKWAGALTDWPGPGEKERPTAYIIVLADTRIAQGVGCDHGIAAQTILLGAVERGLGGCMMGAIDREGLRRTLRIRDWYEILLVIALGKPVEEVVIENARRSGDTTYWRDEKGVHHVPKRSLGDIVI